MCEVWFLSACMQNLNKSCHNGINADPLGLSQAHAPVLTQFPSQSGNLVVLVSTVIQFPKQGDNLVVPVITVTLFP